MHDVASHTLRLDGRALSLYYGVAQMLLRAMRTQWACAHEIMQGSAHDVQRHGPSLWGRQPGDTMITPVSGGSHAAG